MACPICQSASTRTKLEKDGVEILECAECGVAWWSPEPGFRVHDTYDAAYFAKPDRSRGYDDYGSLSGSLGKTFAQRMKRHAVPAAGGRLLDMGAAYGFAMKEAERAGWSTFGLELSRDAARQAESHCPGRVTVGVGEATPFADESFDVVTAWDVIEHLPRPRAAVAEASRLLAPGGRLDLTTGDVGSLVARMSGPKWHLYTIPEHLFFFSRTSLVKLLESEGFEIESLRSEGAYYTLGYLIERLSKTLLGRESSMLATWPGSGLAVPVNLFDIVRVTARKR